MNSLIQDIIGSIVSPRRRFGSGNMGRRVEDLCHELLSNRGEVSGKRIGSAILNKYEDMDDEQKVSFFTFLTEELDLDFENVARTANEYGTEKSASNLQDLLQASEPPRQELLRRLNQVPGATQALVSMRSDLLVLLKTNPALKRMDLDFQHLLASWFNRGFLDLRPISWETPANILAKIIQYEAVHAINDWNDLRRRLQPSDRRCFAFFHPSMPNEPLVFVEIALCKGVPGSVQSVLEEQRDELNEDAADTAVFYSISNCQTGLRGISFGNFLIKQVANDLSAELPNLKTFVTLSPIPGLADWVSQNTDDVPEGLSDHLAKLQQRSLADKSGEPLQEIAGDLKILAAKYLLQAKRRDGLPVDPVARFHLGNGACVHMLHAAADISHKGISHSYGLMVNYLYDMGKAETRHEEFASSGKVDTSKQVRNLANSKYTNFNSITSGIPHDEPSV